MLADGKDVLFVIWKLGLQVYRVSVYVYVYVYVQNRIMKVRCW